MRQNPYVGPRSFRTGERLYGRDRDLRRLLDLLIAERIVLLHAPSGAGKTSLVQAALLPALQAEGFAVLPPMRVNLEPPADNDGLLHALLGLGEGSGAPPPNRYVLSALISLEEGLPAERQLPVSQLSCLSLDAYLSHREAGLPENDGLVLLFDQFEEILTIDPTDIAAKEAFFAQVGAALYNRTRWALFSMRDDYVGSIEPFLRPIPTQLANTFHLDLLDLKGALEAMQLPVKAVGATFTDAAARQLADDLRRVVVMHANGHAVEQLGPYLEPLQLQVVCYRLWASMPEDDLSVDPEDVAALGDVDQALTGYYAERAAAIADTSGISERSIREWCEHDLITEQGIRGQVLEGAARLDRRAIAGLVDAHLVRGEKRRGATWLELAHDRLIAPIKADNAAWREAHLSPLQRQASLWERQARPDGLLFREETLREAEQWADENAGALTQSERDFLEASREARAQSERERRATRRIRRLGISSAVAGVAAIVIAGLAIWQFFEASEAKKDAERSAQEAQVRALTAQSSELREERPQQSLLLAVEALRRAQDYGLQTSQPNQALRAILNQAGGAPLYGPPDNSLRVAFFTDDNSAIVGVDSHGRIWRWAVGESRGALIIDQEERANFYSTFSANRQVLVLSGGDRIGVARVADLEAGVTWLNGSQHTILEVSPDGRWVLSGTLDAGLQRWDTTRPLDEAVPLADSAGTIVSNLSPTDSSPYFSRDSQYVFLSDGSTLRRWSMADVTSPPVTSATQLPSGSDGFSDDGRWYSSLISNTLQIWNLEQPDVPAFTIPLINDDTAYRTTAISPDASIAVVTNPDGGISVFSLGSDRKEIQLTIAGFTNALLIAPDNRHIAATVQGQGIIIWDITKPDEQPLALRGLDDASYPLQFSPDSASLLTISGGQAHLWNLNRPNEGTFRLSGNRTGVSRFQFVGDEIQGTDQNGDVLAWSLSDPGSPARYSLADDKGLYVWAVSPDSTLLAVREEDGSLVLRHRDYADIFGTLLRAEDWDGFASIEFSGDGRLLALIDYHRQEVSLWDISDLTRPTSLATLERMSSYIDFSPDGRYLAAARTNGGLTLWRTDNLDAGPIELHIDSSSRFEVGAVSFSADGRYLAAGGTQGNHSGTGNVWIWEQPAEQPSGRVFGKSHDSAPFVIAFGVDRLAVGFIDNSIYVWRAGVEQQEPLVIRQAKLASMVFSPDEQSLLTQTQDATVHLFFLDDAQLVESACRIAARNLSFDEWQDAMPDQPYRKTCPQAPLHWSLVQDALEMVRSSDQAAVVSRLHELVAMDPGLQIDPEAEVRHAAAVEVIAVADDQLADGDYAAAMASYQQAQQLEPDIPIYWWVICPKGALDGAAEIVLPACDAYATSSPSPMSFDYRAAARALTGDLQGALADVEHAISLARISKASTYMPSPEEFIERRIQWAAELRAGRSPYSEDVLKELWGG